MRVDRYEKFYGCAFIGFARYPAASAEFFHSFLKIIQTMTGGKPFLFGRGAGSGRKTGAIILDQEYKFVRFQFYSTKTSVDTGVFYNIVEDLFDSEKDVVSCFCRHRNAGQMGWQV